MNQIYADILNDLVKYGDRIPMLTSARCNTGDFVEIRNYKFTLYDITKNFATIRKPSRVYAAAEFLWYMSGRNDLDFISKFSKEWRNLSDDNNTCNSAYGHIMMKKFNFDQIQNVITELMAHPSSRRAKINISSASDNLETNDEPCTMYLQYFLRNDKLHCTCCMRSNDAWFGLPYDVFFFTELQKFIADQLGVDYGYYTHFVGSLHYYARDEQKIFHTLQDSYYFMPEATSGINTRFLYNMQDMIISNIDLMNSEDARKYLKGVIDNEM